MKTRTREVARNKEQNAKHDEQLNADEKHSMLIPDSIGM